ncbi:hypothetical protein SAMN05446935_7641 [Burkholderia sp. YR290]|nr:hypothetical protein SAMN05446935_7641 [Burkholderia sp. YR290]
MQTLWMERLMLLQVSVERTAEYCLSENARLIADAQTNLDAATEAKTTSGTRKKESPMATSSIDVEEAKQRLLTLEHRQHAWEALFQDLREVIEGVKRLQYIMTTRIEVITGITTK